MGNENIEIMLLLIFFIVVLSLNRWERNMGERREENRGRKMIKERKKGGDG
jgi:hypothetical protein